MPNPPSPQPIPLYTAFGLCIRSCLTIPELDTFGPSESIDIEIRYGSFPENLENAVATGVRYQSAPGALLLKIDNVGRFLVRDGKSICIERHPEADDDDLRVFLLGSALGALLHQRGDLALHGSSVVLNGLAVAFVAPSGAGKSTLAAALRQRGHPLLSDDLCVLRPTQDGAMMAYPGFPQTKLWLDSLQQLDLSADGLRRIRRKIEKRALPIDTGFAREAAPLKRVYLLQPGNGREIKITAIEGSAKFAVLKANTFRFGFVADIEGKAAHFTNAARLAQQIRLAAVERPRKPFLLNELADRIEADARL